MKDTLYAYPSNYDARHRGMTLHDYFAGLALAGVLNKESVKFSMISEPMDQAEVVMWAASLADQIATAMLKARGE